MNGPAVRFFTVALTSAVVFGAFACEGPRGSRSVADAPAASGSNEQSLHFVTTAGEAPDVASPSARKLVRTAGLEIEVRALDPAVAEVRKIATSNGGFVARENSDRGDGDARATRLEIRVAADRLDGALASLRSLGTVNAERAETRDVTRDVFDVETRLSVKRDTEARLRALLRDRPAKVSEIVEVERELDRIVTEIERLEGERRFLEHEVALSAVNVGLSERGARPDRGVAGPVRLAVRRAWDVFGESVAGLIYVAVFVAPWLVVATAGWWLVRTLRRRRRVRPSS